jgi:hypothetical protein
LDSDIYILPIKIDACEVPMKLQRFQYVENHENVFTEVLNAIDFQRQSLLYSSKTLELVEGTIQITDKVLQGELGDISPKHIYEFHYPQFNLSDNESLNDLNTIINNDILISIVSVRNNFHNFLLYNGKEHALDSDNPEDSTSYGKIEIKLFTPFFVSLTSFISEYYTGTTHGEFGTHGMNYYNNPIRSFHLVDLFDDENKYGCSRGGTCNGQ